MVRINGAGTWIGDTWIPAGGKLNTVAEIHAMFHGQMVLVIGDSMARRLAATFAIVLNATGDSVTSARLSDAFTLSADGHAHGNYRWRHGHIAYMWAPLAKDVLAIANSARLSTQYSVVIIAIGTHDALKVTGTPPYQIQMNSTRAWMKDDVLALLKQLAPINCSIWRTAPPSCSRNNPHMYDAANAQVAQISAWVDQAHPPKMRVAHFGTAMHPKSAGSERLWGDTDHHLNGIGRMVEVQIVADELRGLLKSTGCT